MSTFIAPTAVAPASGQPPTQAGPRGRFADEPQGRSFGAVLDRSRAAGARQSADASDALPADAAAAPQKSGRASDKKEEPASDLLTIALFAPAIAAANPTPTTAAPGGGLPGDAAAEVAMTADTAQGPLLAKKAAATETAAPEAAADADADAAAGTLPAAQSTDPKAKTLPEQPAAPKAETTTALPPSASIAGAAGASAQPAAAAVPMPTPPAASTVPAAKAPASGAAVLASAAEQQNKVASSPQAADASASPIAAATSPDRQDTAAAGPATPLPSAASVPAFAPSTVDRPQAGTAAAPTTMTVAPPVGSPEWGPAIGQQMLRMSAGGHQVAELNLNPAGLGPLKVTLSLGDNQAQAMFVSAHEAVRKAVEAALPQLRSTLAEQGISLGQTSVGAESRPWAGQGGGFGQQQQQQAPSRQAEYPGASRADAPAAAAPRSNAATRRSSGLDTFA